MHKRELEIYWCHWVVSVKLFGHGPHRSWKHVWWGCVKHQKVCFWLARYTHIYIYKYIYTYRYTYIYYAKVWQDSSHLRKKQLRLPIVVTVAPEGLLAFDFSISGSIIVAGINVACRRKNAFPPSRCLSSTVVMDGQGIFVGNVWIQMKGGRVRGTWDFGSMPRMTFRFIRYTILIHLVHCPAHSCQPVQGASETSRCGTWAQILPHVFARLATQRDAKNQNHS